MRASRRDRDNCLDTHAVQTAHGRASAYHRTDDAHTLLMVAALLLLTRVRPLELRSRAAVAMQATPPRDWATREDFALLDGAPAFSVGSGAQAVTFWQSMVASTPELAARSAEDCERRWAELKPADVTAARVGPQPAVLEEWSRMADGRLSGRIAGQPSAVWLTVALEGRLASDPRVDEPGYIEAVGGRIYALGAARSPPRRRRRRRRRPTPPPRRRPCRRPPRRRSPSRSACCRWRGWLRRRHDHRCRRRRPRAARHARLHQPAGSKAEQTSQQLQQLAGRRPSRWRR